MRDWRRYGLARRFNDLFCHEEWNIGIVHAPIHAFLEPEMKLEIQWFPRLERGRFLADPFGIVRDGTVFVICEEFDYRSEKGVVSCIDSSSQALSPRVIIDLPVHASYPYTFEHQGEIYCIPETYQAREVMLYKADKFPYTWVKKATLIDGVPAVDNTVFHFGDRWWLMCTDQDEGPFDRLFVWHAPDLFGPWKPHAANPVKVDLRSTRPAGTPFVHRGHLYRPAQDCLRTYGGRVVINRILRLTPTEFEEEPAAFIEPSRSTPYSDGLHTVSAVGEVTLVDGKRFTFVRSAFARAARRERNRLVGSVSGLLRED